MAYVYPRDMRSTRDLLRRRLYLVRKRGQLLAHIQNTHHQCNLPEPSRKIIYKANREGLAERFTDPAVRKSIAIDLELAEHYDLLIRDLELDLVRSAKLHAPHTFHLLRSLPGVGKVLALTLLYEIHDIQRFPRVQEFASYARLVKCSRASSGKTLGTGGAKTCAPTPAPRASYKDSGASTAGPKPSPSSPTRSAAPSITCCALKRCSI